MKKSKLLKIQSIAILIVMILQVSLPIFPFMQIVTAGDDNPYRSLGYISRR